jgi:hypothetical protein
MEQVGSSSQSAAFKRVDITRVALPEGISRAAVEREIHVIADDGKVYRNAGAILKILEQYPRLKFLARLGNLPLVTQFLSIGYRVVAAHRHFIFGPASRIFWLRITVGAALLAGLLLSRRLWLSSRLYPLTPVLRGLPSVPPPFDYLMLVALLLGAIAIILSNNPGKFIFGFVGLGVMLSLLDQSRWQPWFDQYLFMLLALGMFSCVASDPNSGSILNTCRLIVASIYFWSGVQKLNPAFTDWVIPWLFRPIWRFLLDSVKALYPPLGFALPFLEMGIGVALATGKFRNVGIVLAVAMHSFILLAIGPLGQSHNSVVWPWNVAMMVFVIILFWKSGEVSFRDIVWGQSFVLQRVVLLLFGIVPLFSFFNLWDSYLSASLYSGNLTVGLIYVNDSVKNKLPPEIEGYTVRVATDVNGLDIWKWSFAELNTPPYPEARVFKSIAKSICRYADNASDVFLIVKEKQTWLNASRRTTYNCSSL